MELLPAENLVDEELQMPSTPTATALSGNRGVDALKGCPELVPLPELQMKMKAVPHWQLSPDQRSISRTFIAKNFSEGLCITQNKIQNLQCVIANTVIVSCKRKSFN
jgi:hypothetical protein